MKHTFALVALFAALPWITPPPLAPSSRTSPPAATRASTVAAAEAVPADVLAEALPPVTSSCTFTCQSAFMCPFIIDFPLPQCIDGCCVYP